MLRVYLDQNKWVDLARAATDHPKGERFTNALTVSRADVATDLASFPLDMYRYLETSKRADYRSRNEVVDIMLELSRQHTMALPQTLLPAEVDSALKHKFGCPTNPRQPQVFGVGSQHILQRGTNRPGLDLRALTADPSVPPELPSLLQRLYAEAVEGRLLRSGPDQFRSADGSHITSHAGQQFVGFEDTIAASIRQWGLKGRDVDLAVRASDLGDIRPAVEDALNRIGLGFEQFVAELLCDDDLRSFMDDLPTRYVTNVMRSAKHRQHEQKWEPNDLVDIIALPVAAVYCDVVVTEKQWVHRMVQGKVHERYDTIITSDVADLSDILVYNSRG